MDAQAIVRFTEARMKSHTSGHRVTHLTILDFKWAALTSTSLKVLSKPKSEYDLQATIKYTYKVII